MQTEAGEGQRGALEAETRRTPSGSPEPVSPSHVLSVGDVCPRETQWWAELPGPGGDFPASPFAAPLGCEGRSYNICKQNLDKIYTNKNICISKTQNRFVCILTPNILRKTTKRILKKLNLGFRSSGNGWRMLISRQTPFSRFCSWRRTDTRKQNVVAPMPLVKLHPGTPRSLFHSGTETTVPRSIPQAEAEKLG